MTVQPTPKIPSVREDNDAFCEQWVNWSRTRRLYGPRPKLTGTLGRIAGTSMRPLHLERDAISSASLKAFHLAYTCQPDGLDRRVFDAYYLHRVKPIKAAAALLGISVRHFYRLLDEFRERVRLAATAIEVAERNDEFHLR